MNSNIECNPNYLDKDNVTCQEYIDKKYCTKNGRQGITWDDKSYPTIDNYFNSKGETPLVCPQCGCGKGTFRLII